MTKGEYLKKVGVNSDFTKQALEQEADESFIKTIDKVLLNLKKGVKYDNVWLEEDKSSTRIHRRFIAP